jgi:hypothetical protein
MDWPNAILMKYLLWLMSMGEMSPHPRLQNGKKFASNFY